MNGKMASEEVLEASEKGERYLFDDLTVRGADGLIEYLREDVRDAELPQDEQYWVWKRHREIDNRVGLGDYNDYPQEYAWPMIVPSQWDRPYSCNGEKTDPDKLTLFPQYFVGRRGNSTADLRSGDWAAVIDRHLKYIAINEDYQDDTELMDALDRFGFVWEQNTTYGGELHNPDGENVPLDYVKFLE